jgi:hypothetical protein
MDENQPHTNIGDVVDQLIWQLHNCQGLATPCNQPNVTM